MNKEITTHVIIGVAAVAVIYFLWKKYQTPPTAAQQISSGLDEVWQGATTAQQGLDQYMPPWWTPILL